MAQPFLIALATADQHAQPVGDFGEIGDIKRAEFTPPEGSREAEAEQRAVPLADHVVRAQGDHLPDQIRGRGRLALLRAADGPADAAEDCLDGLGIGRRLVAGELVAVADRGGPSADGGRPAAAVGEGGEIGGDDPDMRRQGRGAAVGAPGGEVAPVRGVGLPGRRRLLRLRVGHGGVDLGNGEGARQRRAEGDQVMQGGLRGSWEG